MTKNVGVKQFQLFVFVWCVPGTESHILVVVDQVDVDFDDGEESLSESIADRLLVLDVRAGVQRDLFIYQFEKWVDEFEEFPALVFKQVLAILLVLRGHAFKNLQHSLSLKSDRKKIFLNLWSIQLGVWGFLFTKSHHKNKELRRIDNRS